MKKLLMLPIVGLFLIGCASSQDKLNEGRMSSVQFIKNGEKLILKPIQNVKCVSENGSYSVKNETSQPILINTQNCKFLVAATQETESNAEMKIDTVSCEIDDKIYASESISGWIMKNNYNGMQLSKNVVKQGEKEIVSYGISPNQEVSIFIKSGELSPLN